MKHYLLFIFILYSQIAWSEDKHDLHFNLVSLQESVEVEVENNLMHARVVVQHVAKKPSEVARLINTDMQWALRLVRKNKTVKAQTLNYSTYPMYKDRKIKSWSGRQEMSLESSDFQKLTATISKLQEKLQVNNIRFSVSSKKYKQTENELISDAIKAFNSKAQLIASSMNKKTYQVVTMNVNTNRQYAQPVSRMSRSKDFMQAESLAIPEPAVAAGTNKVRINVSGQIQIK